MWDVILGIVSLIIWDLLAVSILFTAWIVSKYEVFSGPRFPVFAFWFLFRRLQDMSSRLLQDVFKASWQTKICYTEKVLKTSSISSSFWNSSRISLTTIWCCEISWINSNSTLQNRWGNKNQVLSNILRKYI